MNTISLFGKWALEGDSHKGLSLTLPGDIHSALLAQNVIPDPYYAKNELDIQWVAKTTWTARRTVKVTKSFLKGQQFVTLECADTYVRVFVNGNEAGLCTNFFRKWRFEVTEFLREGLNEIALVFEPSENYALEAAKKLGMPIPTTEYDSCLPGSPHRNLVRKVQCHSGWDWGPCIMAMGVYETLCLEQTETCFVDAVQTETTRVGGADVSASAASIAGAASENISGTWNLHVKAWITAIKPCAVDVAVLVRDEGARKDTAAWPSIDPVGDTLTKVRLNTGENLVEFDLTVRNPAPWYASGTSPADEEAARKGLVLPHPENPLYEVTVTAGKASRTVKTAFRKLVVHAEEDERGHCLYFSVDGRPVFSKGYNWIPADALPSRQTPGKYGYLLTSLVAANCNTIRVWGGGQYEKEIFYELCDRKGIFVWQDMMFACSMYPADDEFLSTVRVEIREQIRRLSHHPSIALWCGNNENLGAIMWYPETRANPQPYICYYDRLNEGVVGDEIKKNDPSRVWWPSSPSAGPNDFSDNWHTDGRGDMHYWTVWHEKKPFEAYYDISPRFVSEFGYQSLPSMSEVRTFAPESQLNLTSPVMEFHQRSVGGNGIMFENFSRYFRVPASFAHMSYLSQVQQALAIKTAVTYWRSLRPGCMGAIVWQLNDVWPIASWSSIEYSGKWKMLHYATKKFAAPIHLALYKKGGTVYAFVLNDTAKDIDATVTIRSIDFAGNEVGEAVTLTVHAPGDSTTKAWECPVAELKAAVDKHFLLGTLTGCGEQAGVAYAEDALFVDLQKHCELEKAGITVSVAEAAGSAATGADNAESETDGAGAPTAATGTFAVTLTAEKPAFYVALDAGAVQGIFSDNFLTLLPGTPKTVYFKQQPLAGAKPGKKATLKAFTKALTVTALNDLY